MSWTFKDRWGHSRVETWGLVFARVTSYLKEVVGAAELMAEPRSSKQHSELYWREKPDRSAGANLW